MKVLNLKMSSGQDGNRPPGTSNYVSVVIFDDTVHVVIHHAG
jgi:hypothetical protein